MKIRYSIKGLDCPNCALKLAEMIEKQEGIDSAKINFLTEKLSIETSLDADAAFELVKKSVKEFGDDDVVVEK